MSKDLPPQDVFAVPSDTSRQFEITHSTWKRCYDLQPIRGSGAPLHASVASNWHRSKPTLTLHAGPSVAGPVVAVCHMPSMTGNMSLGLGDPGAAAAAALAGVQWVDMHHTGIRSADYAIGLPLPGPAGQQGQFVQLQWKRTHHEAVDGQSVSALSVRNFKLVDAQTGALLAVFNGQWGPSRCGTLQINVQFGREFDVMVQMSCLAIIEKMRRRSQRSAAAGVAASG